MKNDKIRHTIIVIIKFIIILTKFALTILAILLVEKKTQTRPG